MRESTSESSGAGSFRRLKTYLFRDVVAASDVGTVYRGYDQAGGGPVWVKIGRPGLAELRVAPELLPQIEHPQIVRIRDAFTSEDGECVLVQEAPASRGVAEARGSLEGQYRQIAHFIREAALVLAAAHEGGVTHGDISERTLLIGEDDLPHLSEFGMGLRTGVLGGEDPALRRGGSEPGEAARDRKLKLDERADLFALGGVLYYLLSGQRVSEQPMALLSDPHAPVDDIAAIDVVAPESPPDLRAICSQALATDPVHRYLHAQQLVADLDAYLFGKRSRRWVKIAFAVVGAAMVVLFGLWGATGGGAARIVAAQLDVQRAGETAGFHSMGDADSALQTGDSFRVAVRLSKPSKASLLYRAPSGAVSLIAGGGEPRGRSMELTLPPGSVGDWHPPPGQGLILFMTHHKPLDARAVEAALLILGDPPRSYAPLAWFGRSLGDQHEPPIIPPEGGGVQRYRTFRAYAEQAVKALAPEADDVAIALVYVVGV